MEQREQMAKLVESYAAVLTALTNETELCYPYATSKAEGLDVAHQKALSNHKAHLIVIMGAALAELAQVQNVSPTVLSTLNALIPIEGDENRPPLTKDALLRELAGSIKKFKDLLEGINLTPANMAKKSIEIKEEMQRCHGFLQKLEQSTEWGNVKDLANLKLLNTVLKAGVNLQADEGRKPRPR